MNKQQKVDAAALLYDRSTMKIIIFACLIIVLAIVFTGAMSYVITRNAVVDKVKSRDLVYIIESATAKIDARITRARETSLMLARDEATKQWVLSAETDQRLGTYAKDKITSVAQQYDYVNSFVVSNVTGNYWGEGGVLLQQMSKNNPNDRWFFETLASGKEVSMNIDYNEPRKNTFVFLNAMIGPLDHPLAVTGVGLSLDEISKEFSEYKFGKNSALWLIDNQGKIYLSDNMDNAGKQLGEFLPAQVAEQITSNWSGDTAYPRILEYVNAAGETIDLAYEPTKSADWKVVLQIDRNESIAVLETVKKNTLLAIVITLLMITLVFYLVSRQIADPLKRAVRLAEKMEEQVQERTQELAEQNEKIMDSIAYARILQESILPTEKEMTSVLGQHFIWWQPRDLVGGDFYWVKQLPNHRKLIAIIDCTGHGVPGAFMTMAANAALKHILEHNNADPASILSNLNVYMKQILHRNNQSRITDDGLDMALCIIENDETIVFAGAKLSLYIKSDGDIQVLKGDNKSIGYKASPDDLVFTNYYYQRNDGDCFYLTTDGYVDQNGGDKDYPIGKRRFIEAILQASGPIAAQGPYFAAIFSNYREAEPQRDDITLLGFSFETDGGR